MSIIKVDYGTISGGGVQPWIDGVLSNNNKTVTFNWSGSAQSYILIFGWANNERACLYSEIGSSNATFANRTNGWYQTFAWSTIGATVVDSPTSLELTLGSTTWSYAFLVPIADTHTIP